MFKSRTEGSVVFKCTVRLLEDHEVLECEFQVSSNRMPIDFGAMASIFSSIDFRCAIPISVNDVCAPRAINSDAFLVSFDRRKEEAKKKTNQLFKCRVR